MVEPLPTFRVVFVPGVTPTKWERIWRERMRRQRLELRPASPREALAALRDGSADAAFLRDAVADEEFSAIRLYEETPVVVASRDHLFAALGPDEQLDAAELEHENVLPGQDTETLELVAAGVGVARMPQSVARALSRRDVIARAVRGAASTTISLVWPIDATTPSVEAFVGIVRGRTQNSSR
jgi:DNA-binding transcriptional LysR family regulator